MKVCSTLSSSFRPEVKCLWLKEKRNAYYDNEIHVSFCIITSYDKKSRQYAKICHGSCF